MARIIHPGHYFLNLQQRPLIFRITWLNSPAEWGNLISEPESDLYLKAMSHARAAVLSLSLVAMLLALPAVIFAQESGSSNQTCKEWWAANKDKPQAMVTPPKCKENVQCNGSIGSVSGRCVQDNCKADTACDKPLEGLPKEQTDSSGQQTQGQQGSQSGTTDNQTTAAERELANTPAGKEFDSIFKQAESGQVMSIPRDPGALQRLQDFAQPFYDSLREVTGLQVPNSFSPQSFGDWDYNQGLQQTINAFGGQNIPIEGGGTMRISPNGQATISYPNTFSGQQAATDFLGARNEVDAVASQGLSSITRGIQAAGDAVSSAAQGIRDFASEARATVQRAVSQLNDRILDGMGLLPNPEEVGVGLPPPPEGLSINQPLDMSGAIVDSMREVAPNTSNEFDLEKIGEKLSNMSPDQLEQSRLDLLKTKDLDMNAARAVAGEVAEGVRAGKVYDLDTLQSAKKAAESALETRTLWQKTADFVGLGSPQSNNLAAIDAAIKSRTGITSPENLANLAESAAGPGRSQGIINQANPEITTNQKTGAEGSQAGITQQTLIGSGLPDKPLGGLAGRMQEADSATEKAAQELRNLENAQVNVSRNGAISGGKSATEVLADKARADALANRATNQRSIAETQKDRAIEETRMAEALQDEAAMLKGRMKSETEVKVKSQTAESGAIRNFEDTVKATRYVDPREAARESARNEILSRGKKMPDGRIALSKSDLAAYNTLIDESVSSDTRFYKEMEPFFNRTEQVSTQAVEAQRRYQAADADERLYVAEANRLGDIARPIVAQRALAGVRYQEAVTRAAALREAYEVRTNDPVMRAKDQGYVLEAEADDSIRQARELRAIIAQKDAERAYMAPDGPSPDDGASYLAAGKDPYIEVEGKRRLFSEYQAEVLANADFLDQKAASSQKSADFFNRGDALAQSAIENMPSDDLRRQLLFSQIESHEAARAEVMKGEDFSSRWGTDFAYNESKAKMDYAEAQIRHLASDEPLTPEEREVFRRQQAIGPTTDEFALNRRLGDWRDNAPQSILEGIYRPDKVVNYLAYRTMHAAGYVPFDEELGQLVQTPGERLASRVGAGLEVGVNVALFAPPVVRAIDSAVVGSWRAVSSRYALMSDTAANVYALQTRISEVSAVADASLAPSRAAVFEQATAAEAAYSSALQGAEKLTSSRIFFKSSASLAAEREAVINAASAGAAAERNMVTLLRDPTPGGANAPRALADVRSGIVTRAAQNAGTEAVMNARARIVEFPETKPVPPQRVSASDAGSEAFARARSTANDIEVVPTRISEPITPPSNNSEILSGGAGDDVISGGIRDVVPTVPIPVSSPVIAPGRISESLLGRLAQTGVGQSVRAAFIGAGLTLSPINLPPISLGGIDIPIASSPAEAGRTRGPITRTGLDVEVAAQRYSGPQKTTATTYGYPGDPFNPDGALTASGAPVSQELYSGAHRELPLGSVMKVKNVGNGAGKGKEIVVVINNRGTLRPGALIDLTPAASRAIADNPAARIGSISTPVEYEVLFIPSQKVATNYLNNAGERAAFPELEGLTPEQSQAILGNTLTVQKLAVANDGGGIFPNPTSTSEPGVKLAINKADTSPSPGPVATQVEISTTEVGNVPPVSVTIRTQPAIFEVAADLTFLPERITGRFIEGRIPADVIGESYASGVFKSTDTLSMSTNSAIDTLKQVSTIPESIREAVAEVQSLSSGVRLLDSEGRALGDVVPITKNAPATEAEANLLAPKVQEIITEGLRLPFVILDPVNPTAEIVVWPQATLAVQKKLEAAGLPSLSPVYTRHYAFERYPNKDGSINFNARHKAAWKTILDNSVELADGSGRRVFKDDTQLPKLMTTIKDAEGGSKRLHPNQNYLDKNNLRVQVLGAALRGEKDIGYILATTEYGHSTHGNGTDTDFAIGPTGLAKDYIWRSANVNNRVGGNALAAQYASFLMAQKMLNQTASNWAGFYPSASGHIGSGKSRNTTWDLLGGNKFKNSVLDPVSAMFGLGKSKPRNNLRAVEDYFEGKGNRITFDVFSKFRDSSIYARAKDGEMQYAFKSADKKTTELFALGPSVETLPPISEIALNVPDAPFKMDIALLRPFQYFSRDPGVSVEVALPQVQEPLNTSPYTVEIESPAPIINASKVANDAPYPAKEPLVGEYVPYPARSNENATPNALGSPYELSPTPGREVILLSGLTQREITQALQKAYDAGKKDMLFIYDGNPRVIARPGNAQWLPRDPNTRFSGPEGTNDFLIANAEYQAVPLEPRVASIPKTDAVPDAPVSISGPTPTTPPSKVEVATNEPVPGNTRVLTVSIDTPALRNGIAKFSAAVQKGLRSVSERIQVAFGRTPVERVPANFPGENAVLPAPPEVRTVENVIPVTRPVISTSPVQEVTVLGQTETSRRLTEAANMRYQEGIGLGRIQTEATLISSEIARSQSPFAIFARAEPVLEGDIAGNLDILETVEASLPKLELLPLNPEVKIVASAEAKESMALAERAGRAAKTAEELAKQVTKLEAAAESVRIILTNYFVNGNSMKWADIAQKLNIAESERLAFNKAVDVVVREDGRLFSQGEKEVLLDIKKLIDETASKVPRSDIRKAAAVYPWMAKIGEPQRFADAVQELTAAATKKKNKTGVFDIAKREIEGVAKTKRAEATSAREEATRLAEAEQLRIAEEQRQVQVAEARAAYLGNRIVPDRVDYVQGFVGTWPIPGQRVAGSPLEIAVAVRVVDPTPTPTTGIVPSETPTPPRPLEQDLGILGTNRQPRVGERLPNELNSSEVPPLLPGPTRAPIPESSISINPEGTPSSGSVPELSIGNGPLAQAATNPTLLTRTRETLSELRNWFSENIALNRGTANVQSNVPALATTPTAGEFAERMKVLERVILENNPEARAAALEDVRVAARAIRDKELAYKMEILGRALVSVPDAKVVAKLDEAINESVEVLTKMDAVETALAKGGEGVGDAQALVLQASDDAGAAVDASRVARAEEIRSLTAIANERVVANTAAKDAYASAARNLEEADVAWSKNTAAADIEAKAAAARAAEDFKAAAELERTTPPATPIALAPIEQTDIIGRIGAWQKGGSGAVPPGGSGGSASGASPPAGGSIWSKTKSAISACWQWKKTCFIVAGVLGVGTYGVVDNATQGNDTSNNQTNPVDGKNTEVNKDGIITSTPPDTKTGVGAKTGETAEDATSEEADKEKDKSGGDTKDETSGERKPADETDDGRNGDDGLGKSGPNLGGGSSGGTRSGSGGFLGGGMSLLGGLFQSLAGLFTGDDPDASVPQTPSAPPPTPQAPVGTIVGNPSLIDIGTTTKLSWSSVGTDVSSSTCAVITADFKVYARGGQNGTTNSPTLTESTRFGIVCNVSNAKDKLLNETLVRVRGDDTDPPRIFGPEQVNAILNSGSGAGSSSESGSAGGSGSGGQSGNPTPEDVRTCDPEQSMEGFIRCLCEAEPNPNGCTIPPGGLRE